MTVLGKVLVFVNLVFALVTAGLITMVFIARTNWRVGYETLEKQLQVARADLATEQESKRLSQQRWALEQQTVEKNLAREREKTAQVEAQLAAEQTERAKAERERDAAKAINETTKEENKRLVTEQQFLQGQVRTRDTEIV